LRAAAALLLLRWNLRHNARIGCAGGSKLASKKSTAPPIAVPESWRHIAEAPKSILGWPSWSKVVPLPTGSRVKTRAGELHTAAAETTEALFQLADATGVGLEGVRLRLTAWAFRRMSDVTATLEVPGGRAFVTIARVDAWPSSGHMNLTARKHPALRHLPTEIQGCHVHRFADNARFGKAAFAPDGNLPVADEIPDGLQSFRDFLRTVSAEFRVDGIEQFNAPDWQVMI
jgi:hypothetical protein